MSGGVQPRHRVGACCLRVGVCGGGWLLSSSRSHPFFVHAFLCGGGVAGWNIWPEVLGMLLGPEKTPAGGLGCSWCRLRLGPSNAFVVPGVVVGGVGCGGGCGGLGCGGVLSVA